MSQDFGQCLLETHAMFGEQDVPRTSSYYA